jgi:AAA15 family ATPase/GTPase
MQMLIHFKVENYLSFDAEQELSMVAGATRNLRSHVYDVKDVGVLKTAVIFGANASGKSNLMRAMHDSRAIIVGGPLPAPSRRCRTDGKNMNRPSSFEYELEIDGRLYSYGFKICLASRKILSEWLYDLSKKTDNSIFVRDSEGRISSGVKWNEEDRKRFEVYSADVRNSGSALFLREVGRLSFGADSDMRVLSDVYGWFVSKLRTAPARPYGGFGGRVGRNKRTWEMLDAFGMGITGASYEDMDPKLIHEEIVCGMTGSTDIPRTEDGNGQALGSDAPCGPASVMLNDKNQPAAKRTAFIHGDNAFDYSEESDGAKALLDLLPIIDDDDGEDGAVYVVDDIDRCLHPRLTQKFIRVFGGLNKDLKRQLIATAHESRLLDLDILRRDEIWFAEKDDAGRSSLSSLEEYNERGDRKIDRAYLDGRYGGVPCFREPFPYCKSVSKY